MSKSTYKNKQIKVNNIPLGNLFKHIGDVISSNNESLNSIMNKIHVGSSKTYLLQIIYNFNLENSTKELGINQDKINEMKIKRDSMNRPNSINNKRQMYEK